MTRSRDLANLADGVEFTAADNTKLDGIEASATADQTDAQIKTAVEAGSDIALGGNPTTTTQSAGNNTTRIATTAFTQAAITALVDSSPASLNTLNELAAALGDDASFSTTVTNSIATKLPLAGGALTGNLSTTGQIDINTGSSGVPTLKFTHTNSGADNFQIQSGIPGVSNGGFTIKDVDASANRFVIDSSGNIGIGTSSVTAGFKLDVVGDARLSDVAGDDGVELGWSSSGYAYVQAFDRAATAQRDLLLNSALRITSGGQVGIGTSSPSSFHNSANQLVISGSGSAGLTIDATSSTNSSIFFADGPTGSEAYRGYIQYQHGGSLSDSFTIGTAATDRIRITNVGRVGIGLNDPDSLLEIKNNDTSSYRFGFGGTSDCYFDADHVYFRTDNGGANTACVTPTGIGIGTTSVDRGKLQVNHYNSISGGVFNTPHIALSLNTSPTDNDAFAGITYATSDSDNYGWSVGARRTSSGIGDFVFTQHSNSTTGSERMRILSGGQLMLGLPAQMSGGDQGIEMDGGTGSIITGKASTNARTHISFVNPNGTVGSITTTGSATAFNTSSDYRLKENVVYDWDATTRLKQLKPARFNFIADADTTVDGFLAHEAQSVVPEAVTGAKDAVNDEGNPEYQGIDQSKLVPLLVKTIQEQQTVIEALTARITALEA